MSRGKGGAALAITKTECRVNVVGGRMADIKTPIERAYAAFNKRDIDGALALMTQDVSWPKASEGRKIVGKDAIRAYWTRQWGEFDPYVEPLAISDEDGGKVFVRVHQLVKDLQGDVVSDSEEIHVFTMNARLIAAMDLGGEADPTAGPSAAFAHRSSLAAAVELSCNNRVGRGRDGSSVNRSAGCDVWITHLCDRAKVG